MASLMLSRGKQKGTTNHCKKHANTGFSYLKRKGKSKSSQHSPRWYLRLLLSKITRIHVAIRICHHITHTHIYTLPSLTPYTLHGLDVPLHLPIRYGFVKQPNLMLSGAAKVVDEIISKHLPRDAVLGHELGRCLAQALCQPRAPI